MDVESIPPIVDSQPTTTNGSDPSLHVLLVHKALRRLASDLCDHACALPPTAPDADLAALSARAHRLRAALSAHCNAEDTAMLPVLKKKRAEHLDTSSDDLKLVIGSKRRASPVVNSKSTVLASPAHKRARSCNYATVVAVESTPGVSKLAAANQNPRLDATLAKPTAESVPQKPLHTVSAVSAARAAAGMLDTLVGTRNLTEAEHKLVLEMFADLDAEIGAVHSQLSRAKAVSRIADCTAKLTDAVIAHLDAEDRFVLPAFRECLTLPEQGKILVQLTLATFGAAVDITGCNAKTTLCALSLDDMLAFFLPLEAYASQAELSVIATAFSKNLPRASWETLCKALPRIQGLVNCSHNPLVEIVYLHKAIRTELNDIVAYCGDVDVSDDLQLQSVLRRLCFLQQVHSCHSDGEDAVLLKELQDCIGDKHGLSPSHVHDDHSDEARLFDHVTGFISTLRQQIASPSPSHAVSTAERKKRLVEIVDKMSAHLNQHMDMEEDTVLPLVRQHFTVTEQDALVRRVMAQVPAPFLHELIPWIMSCLSVDDQEKFLRNVLRTSTSEEFENTVARPLAVAVCEGWADRNDWIELRLRIPELSPDDSLDVWTNAADDGPVSEVLRVHKAIRVELQGLLRLAFSFAVEHVPNPKTLDAMSERVAFLSRMVNEHSKAEDFVLLPRLEERMPGVSFKYGAEHCEERALFSRLSALLRQLQCASNDANCEQIVRQVRVVTRTLRDEMVNHLRKEEQQLWPILTRYFSKKEQTEIVALIFGRMPSERLQELLPWMIRVLSVSEQTTMITHILQVTKSTMFEQWLNTWFPHIPSQMQNRKVESTAAARVAKRGVPDVDSPKNLVSSTTQSTSHCAGPVSFRSDTFSADGIKGEVGDDAASAAAALVLLQGRDNMERVIREIAKDTSLSIETRTRMMQQVMLAPWSKREGANARNAELQCCGKQVSRSLGETGDMSPKVAGSRAAKREPRYIDSAPSFRDVTSKVLGCSHYARGCKLRAACCDKIYTCRLCHDEAETHVMDRTATKEMLCMHCGTLQTVAQVCRVDTCRRHMAHYFCAICKFFDDDRSRSIYHCHSCNVCRAGKGLGQDFFHCMKCNQCMSMKFVAKHNCIERAMESDCPVCHQYLFASTTPVKYLRCGHLMHATCKVLYVEKGNFSCPVCSKSLEDMAPVFEKLDCLLATTTMPYEYRTARCSLMCLDCNQASTVPYHFLYNKCPCCSSYNTRVDSVDANAGATRPTE